MADWTDDIENKVYSVIKYKLKEIYQSKYPNMDFGTDEQTTKEPKFPYVYVHLLPMVEQGQDLENRTINSVLATFQISVTSNKSKEEVNKVINEIKSILKLLKFNIISFPEISKDGDIYSSVLRARRVIASGDKF